MVLSPCSDSPTAYVINHGAGRYLEGGNSRLRVVGDLSGKDQTRNDDKTEHRRTRMSHSNRPRSPYRLSSRNTHYARSPAGVRVTSNTLSNVRTAFFLCSHMLGLQYSLSVSCRLLYITSLDDCLIVLAVQNLGRSPCCVEGSGSKPSVSRKPIVTVPRKK